MEAAAGNGQITTPVCLEDRVEVAWGEMAPRPLGEMEQLTKDLTVKVAPIMLPVEGAVEAQERQEEQTGPLRVGTE